MIRRHLLLLFILFSQTRCATHKTEIFLGSLLGASAGAAAGYAFVYHGRNGQNEVRNTIITSAVFGLITAGILAWHYREVNEAVTELSGKYSRYRLCDQTNNPSSFLNNAERAPAWTPEQIGKYSVLLDDSTRWVLPVFNKRWLGPETENDQLVTSHFVWEVTQPGYFLSREKNPDVFKSIEKQEKEPEKSQIHSKEKHQ